MNKTIIIFVSLILLLIGAILFTVFSKNQDKNINPNVQYTDLKITFPSEKGNQVVTKNFLTDTTVTPDEQNPGMYFLGDTIAIQPATGKLPPYVVTYDKNSSNFNVTLLEKPFKQSREQAEEYLKTLLETDEESLCKLSYMVTVPGYVDASASGLDYRFSFCSDGLQL